jgi:hypothetical protein
MYNMFIRVRILGKQIFREAELCPLLDARLGTIFIRRRVVTVRAKVQAVDVFFLVSAQYTSRFSLIQATIMPCEYNLVDSL